MDCFKQNISFQERLEQSERLRQKYPDKIPIICEKNKNEKRINKMEKTKFLVNSAMTSGHFLAVIRSKIKLENHVALFIFYGNSELVSNSELLSDVYLKLKDRDGFLYANYSSENTFG